MADHVPDRHAAGPFGDCHSHAAQGARTLASKPPAFRRLRRLRPTRCDPPRSPRPPARPVADPANPTDGPTPAASRQLGSISELFGDPRWRRNTIVGMLLAFSGVVGLWGIGFFSFDLIRDVFSENAVAMAVDEGLTEAPMAEFQDRLADGTIRLVTEPDEVPKEPEPGIDYIIAADEERGLAAFLRRHADVKPFVDAKLTQWVGYVSFVQNGGAFFGIYAFSLITVRIGRKPAFAIAFVLAMAATAFTFLFLGRIAGFWDVYWMIPIMGFCQLSLFGGYAIYFPELFPTRLRSTGTSFCYNVGRFVAATGPLGLGALILLYDDYTEIDSSLPMRYAGVTMCAVFLVGLVALPFAPETKELPLPE